MVSFNINSETIFWLDCKTNVVNKSINIMLKSILNVQVNMMIKILILKSKYVVRKKYVHVRARRRTITDIEFIGMGGLVNLSSK